MSTDNASAPTGRPEAPRDPPRQRPIQLLRDTLSTLCHFVWHRETRPGEHLWSIPVDKDRDFDCILSDAIDELEALRAALRANQTDLRIELLTQERDQLIEQLTKVQSIEIGNRHAADDELADSDEIIQSLRDELAALRAHPAPAPKEYLKAHEIDHLCWTLRAANPGFVSRLRRQLMDGLPEALVGAEQAAGRPETEGQP